MPRRVRASFANNTVPLGIRFSNQRKGSIRVDDTNVEASNEKLEYGTDPKSPAIFVKAAA